MQFSSTRWVITTVALTIAACDTASCQPQQNAPAPGSAEAAAATMWRSISTACPAQTGATSTFFRYEKFGSLIEYRDVRKSVFHWKVTKADELNGTQFRGLAVFSAAAHRTYEPSKGTWSAWLPPQDLREDFGNEARYLGHNRTYWPERWEVVMEKRNGGWSFLFDQRHAVDLNPKMMRPDGTLIVGDRDPLSLGKPFDLASLAGMGPKLSCAELTSEHPGGSVPAANRQPQPKAVPQELKLSDWITLTDSALFVLMFEEEFQRVATDQSDFTLAAQLRMRASSLVAGSVTAQTLGPPTRFRMALVNGQPIVIKSAIVVRLEDGRPGLVPQSTK
jgi:hypothetical protein